MAPLDGAARMVIDQKVAQVAADVGVSEAAALKRMDDRVVIELAGNTAQTWHASQMADEVAGGGCGARVGRRRRSARHGAGHGRRPDAPPGVRRAARLCGEPLDPLGVLGAALREATQREPALNAQESLETLSTAERTSLRAADGTVQVVVADSARPQFARQLLADSELAWRLQP